MLTLAIALALAPAAVPVTEMPDITYRTIAGEELKLDLYRPATRDLKPRPLVVLIHGGAWMGGTRKDFAEMGRRLAEQDMIVASVGYRLAPKHKWPSMIDDVQSAVRYLRSKSKDYGIDPKRVAAGGASAGAHLALLLGLTDTKEWSPKSHFLPNESSRVGAVLNIFGPTDLTQDYEPQLAGMVSQAVLGKPYAEAMDTMKAFSPVNHIQKGDAPVFTIHGTADETVPIEQARRLDRALKAAGVSHEMVIIEGMGHEMPMDKPEVQAALVRAVMWLRKNLGMPAIPVQSR